MERAQRTKLDEIEHHELRVIQRKFPQQGPRLFDAFKPNTVTTAGNSDLSSWAPHSGRGAAFIQSMDTRAH